MRRLRIAVIIVIALALLILVGALLYKHFITDQIRDKGGMENPNYLMELENARLAEPTDTDAPQ